MVVFLDMSHGSRLKTWSAGAVRSSHAKAHLRRGSKSVDSSTMVADALMTELKYQMRSAQQRQLRVRRRTFTSPPRHADRFLSACTAVVLSLMKKNCTGFLNVELQQLLSASVHRHLDLSFSQAVLLGAGGTCPPDSLVPPFRFKS